MVIDSAVEGLACLSHILLSTLLALDEIDNIAGLTGCICFEMVCLSSDLACELIHG